MKDKKERFLRVVKCNNDINNEARQIAQKLAGVRSEMQKIIDLIDSNTEKDVSTPPPNTN